MRPLKELFQFDFDFNSNNNLGVLTMLRLILVFMFFTIPLTSFGGDVNGKIVRLSVRSDVVYVRTDPTPAEKSECATNPGWDYAFSIANETGKATLSMALAAYTSKAPVTIKSSNQCTHYSTMEDISYLILDPH